MADADEAADRPAGGDRRWRARLAPQLRPRLALLFAQLLGGVALGLLWAWWSPRSVAYVVQISAGHTALVPPESESQVAADGRFVVLSAIIGVAFGVAAWLTRRVRGPVTVVCLAAGAVLSSLVAAGVGHLVSSGSGSGAVNTVVTQKLALHGVSWLWVQAFCAVLVYVAIAGLLADPTLGRSAPPRGARDGAGRGDAPPAGAGETATSVG